MRFQFILFLLVNNAFSVWTINTTCNDQELPNIIIMLMDDMGWGDLGIFGEPNQETPNLDQMAREGVLLPDFYAANPLCSPSRAALLTGRLPIRNGFYTDNAHARNGYAQQDIVQGISKDEILFSELLADKGYTNMIIGKWHLGHAEQYLPLKHGFHQFFGSPDVHFGPYNDINTPNIPMFRDDKMIGRYYEEFGIDQKTGLSNLTQLYIAEAVKFIKSQTKCGSPFFLYWTPDSSHGPLYASRMFRGLSRRGLYGDTVMELDYGVGVILQLLKDLGIDKNTFVLFTSDNGPSLVSKNEGGSSGPFLCGKQTTFEGGYREPTIAWWPGMITPNTINHQVGNVMDLFNTALELAKIPLPNDRTIDGISLVNSLITGQETDRPTFYYRGNELFALRYGLYKAHYWCWTGPTSEKKQGIEYCPGQVIPGITVYDQTNYTDSPILFHLGRDPAERFPISNTTTEYRQAMSVLNAIADQHRKELVPGVPVLNMCDNAAQGWAPPGCEELNKCLPVPKSAPYLCQWPH